MTRHVVSNSQVTHLWANQSQDWARGPSISFNGHYLSSYRTVIARLMPEVQFKGKPVALINDNHWGVTTAKHIGYAHRALIRYHWNNLGNGQSEYVDDTPWHVFSVDRVQGEWGNRDNVPHERNVMVKFAAYEERVARIVKPHVSWYGMGDTLEARQKAIFEAASDYREYAQCFNVQEPYPNFDYWLHVARVNWAKYYDPKAAGQRNAREAAARQRDAKRMAWVYAYVEGVGPKPYLDGLSSKLKREATRMVQSHEWKLNPYRGATPITPEQWLEGKGSASQYWYGTAWDRQTLLRRKGDSVQTSRGAEVPWADALRAWRVIQKVRCSGQEYTPNGLRHGVGGFAINKIEANGRMTIGCHILEYGEMLRLALHDAPETVIACYPVPAPLDLPQDFVQFNGTPITMDMFDIQPGEE